MKQWLPAIERKASAVLALCNTNTHITKKPAALLLILVTTLACLRVTPPQGGPRDVLGVTLGGPAGDLETVYRQKGLPLTREGEGDYVSADVVDPPAGLKVKGVSYRVSSGLVRTMEVSFAGDVSGALQTFIDGKYGIDPARRLQFEQKQRFVGTIGEEDHFWQLPDMGVMVIVRKDGTRLIYDLK